MSRCTLTILAVLALAPRSAAADEGAGYGVALGIAAPVETFDTLGVSMGLSAFRADLGGPRAMLRVSGELLGFITTDTQAVLPTLRAELGTRVGDAELFLSAGVQMFGWAWQQDYTLFGVMGLTGGVGMALNVSPRVRVGFRGGVTWLPSDSTAIVVEGDGDKPSFAMVSLMLTLELSPRPVVRRPAWHDLTPPEL